MPSMRAPFGTLVVLTIVVAAVMLVIPPFDPKHAQPIDQQTEVAVNTTEAVLRRIVDARIEPYAAIGRFEGTMICTAAIVVDPRIIITAGHCVTERDGSIRKSNLSFRLGYQAGNDLGRFEAMVWAVGSRQSFKRQSVHEASQDWALLALDRTPKGVRPFLVSHQPFEALKSQERHLLMPSYSNDMGKADALSVDPACSIYDQAWDVLVHDCRAGAGSSGAPLLMRDGPRYAVVGIHTGSMFASDKDGLVAKFVGYRAIGTWMFTESLVALSRHLAGEASQAGDSPTQ